uniref:Fatty acid desaturase domain-containing protein n=1 Tax=Aureoumbra lagunensis TaxID=44058 RepID=A0A7S3JRG9_9STRA
MIQYLVVLLLSLSGPVDGFQMIEHRAGRVRNSGLSLVKAAKVSLVESATMENGKLDVRKLSAEAAFETKPLAQVWGLIYFGIMTTAVFSTILPGFVRLILIQYIAFSFFEYSFHRWCMHAPRGSVRDKIFARWNRLHVQHHVDTNNDMTMIDDYNFKGIRFNYLTSKLAVVIGSLISLAFCALTGLSSDLPLWLTPVAASIVSLYHGFLWQRLHVDSHSLNGSIEWDDGLPYLDAIPTGNRYARWLLTNHIGHHWAGGKSNYNIVFPGPDHLFGTFVRLKQ